MVSRLSKAGESARDIVEMACDRLQHRDYSEEMLLGFEEILSNDWFDSADDLRIAILDGDAWSSIKLPGRLKLEMKRVMRDLEEKEGAADVRVAASGKDRKGGLGRSPPGSGGPSRGTLMSPVSLRSAAAGTVAAARFVPKGEHSAPPTPNTLPPSSSPAHAPISTRTTPAPAPLPAPAPAPTAKWIREYSIESSNYYYVNTLTGESQWEVPAGYADQTTSSYDSLISNPAPRQHGAPGSSEYYPSLPSVTAAGASNGHNYTNDHGYSYNTSAHGNQSQPQPISAAPAPAPVPAPVVEEREFDPDAMTEAEIAEQKELLSRFSKEMQRDQAPALVCPPSALSSAYSNYGGGSGANQSQGQGVSSGNGANYGGGNITKNSDLAPQPGSFSTSSPYGAHQQQPIQYSNPSQQQPQSQPQPQQQYQQQYQQNLHYHQQQQHNGTSNGTYGQSQYGQQQHQQHQQQYGGSGDANYNRISYGQDSYNNSTNSNSNTLSRTSSSSSQYGNPAISSGSYSGYGSSAGYGPGSTQTQHQRPLSTSSMGSSSVTSPNSAGSPKAPSATVFTQSVNQLIAMGFDSKAASKALIDCQFDVQAAAEMLAATGGCSETSGSGSARSSMSGSTEMQMNNDPTAANGNADTGSTPTTGKAKSKLSGMKNLLRGVGLGKQKSASTGMMADPTVTVESGTASIAAAGSDMNVENGSAGVPPVAGSAGYQRW